MGCRSVGSIRQLSHHSRKCYNRFRPPNSKPWAEQGADVCLAQLAQLHVENFTKLPTITTATTTSARRERILAPPICDLPQAMDAALVYYKKLQEPFSETKQGETFERAD